MRRQSGSGVECYWDEAFGEEWARLEPRLEDIVEVRVRDGAARRVDRSSSAASELVVDIAERP